MLKFFGVTINSNNITSLSVVFGLLGKRATAIYQAMLSFFAVLSGLILDMIYTGFGVSATAIVGQVGEIIPFWLQFLAVLIVIGLSVKPLFLLARRFFSDMRRVVQKKSPQKNPPEKAAADNTQTECRGPT